MRPKNLAALFSGLLVGGVLAGAALGISEVTAPGGPDPVPRDVLLAKQLVKERKAHAQEVRSLRKAVRRWKVAVRHDPEVNSAITIASALTGIGTGALWKVAKCESTHNPHARNGQYVGLFQFGSSAWSQAWGRSSGSLNRTDPHASAIGHARIVSREGYSQWSCKP